MTARACCLPGSAHLSPGALIFSLLALALAGPARAEQVSPAFAQGTHFFRRILHTLELHPLENFAQLANDPSKTLLIVLGEATHLDPDQIASFITQGGAMLLATDRECYTVAQPFGVEIVGRHLMVSAKTRFAYKGLEECIFVQPRGTDSPLFENLAVEDGLSRVATNRPGYLTSARGSKLKILATFPPGCRLMYPRTARRGPYVERSSASSVLLPFAIGGDWGQGLYQCHDVAGR
jgi:hypothetical protein